MEIWKDIKNYEGIYLVSNLGNVKSIGRNISKIMFGGKNSSYFRKERILKPGYLRGYQHVSLCKDGNIKIFKVHRLVANAFINNLENKLQVNHKDGNKSNNKVENLEWVTAYENTVYSKSTSIPGITYSNNKFRVRYRQKHYGYFKYLNDAIAKLDELKFNDTN